MNSVWNGNFFKKFQLKFCATPRQVRMVCIRFPGCFLGQVGEERNQFLPEAIQVRSRKTQCRSVHKINMCVVSRILHYVLEIKESELSKIRNNSWRNIHKSHRTPLQQIEVETRKFGVLVDHFWYPLPSYRKPTSQPGGWGRGCRFSLLQEVKRMLFRSESVSCVRNCYNFFRTNR